MIDTWHITVLNVLKNIIEQMIVKYYHIHNQKNIEMYILILHVENILTYIKMNRYLTEIDIWNWKIYAWPDIYANSFEEAEEKCLPNFIVIWELKGIYPI